MQKLTSILVASERFHPGGELLLEKAVTLARAFGARVDLLISDAAEMPRFAALCGDKSYDEVLLCSVSDRGYPLQEAILRRAYETRPDLIMKTPAGEQPLRRWTIADNDWHLAQECPVPLLLARERRWGTPLRLAATVDMADSAPSSLARTILHTAGFLALGCHGDLDVLYSEREEHDETLRMARAVKLAQMVREFNVGRENVRLLSGGPERTLPKVLASRAYDLLVLGSEMQPAGLAAVTGGLSSRLVEAVDSDILFIKLPEPKHTRTLGLDVRPRVTIGRARAVPSN